MIRSGLAPIAEASVFALGVGDKISLQLPVDT
jgi:hypothetical protein